MNATKVGNVDNATLLTTDDDDSVYEQKLPKNSFQLFKKKIKHRFGNKKGNNKSKNKNDRYSSQMNDDMSRTISDTNDNTFTDTLQRSNYDDNLNSISSISSTCFTAAQVAQHDIKINLMNDQFDHGIFSHAIDRSAIISHDNDDNDNDHNDNDNNIDDDNDNGAALLKSMAGDEEKIVEMKSRKRKNPLFLNLGQAVRINKFCHARPIAGVKYFKEISAKYGNGLAVLIPIYNETPAQLERTLMSIWRSHQCLCEKSLNRWNKKPFNICIILDGWFEANESMRKYLKKIFSKKIIVDVNDHDDADDNDDDADGKEEEEEEEAQEKKSKEKRKDKGKQKKQKRMFWWDYYKEFDINSYNKEKDGSVTFIIEKQITNYLSFFTLQYYRNNKYKKERRISKQARLHITLIIKIDKRRLDNSYEWFLSKKCGFASKLQCKYILLTTPYIMFKIDTLYKLIKYLDCHSNYCGITGRQCIMNRRRQYREEIESSLSIEYFLRLTQIYLNEFNQSVFNPTYNMIGFLPLLPKECALYNTKFFLNNNVLDWYFNFVNRTPIQTGIINANFRLQPDRILTYAAILKSQTKSDTKSHNLRNDNYSNSNSNSNLNLNNLKIGYRRNALYYFQAQTQMECYIFEKRKLINSTFAGYIYLLFSSPKHYWYWKRVTIFRKIIIFCFLLLSLFQMIGLIITPALSFRIFNLCLRYLCQLSNIDEKNQTLQVTVIFLCFAIWTLHIVVHNTHKFNRNLVTFLYFLSFVITSAIVTCLIDIIAIKQYNFQQAMEVLNLDNNDKLLNYSFATKIVYLICFTIIGPFICCLLSDIGNFRGFGLLCKTIIPFVFSFFLLIPWFSSYAFARCWDLTLTNRGDNDDNNDDSKEIDTTGDAVMRIENDYKVDIDIDIDSKDIDVDQDSYSNDDHTYADDGDCNGNEKLMDGELIDDSSSSLSSDGIDDVHYKKHSKNKTKLQIKTEKAQRKKRKQFEQQRKKQKEKEKEKLMQQENSSDDSDDSDDSDNLGDDSDDDGDDDNSSLATYENDDSDSDSNGSNDSDSESDSDNSIAETEEILIPETTEMEIVKSKFRNESKWIVLFIICCNIGVYMMGIYYNILVITGILTIIAIFIVFSIIALIFGAIKDCIDCLCNSCWSCLCRKCTCCRWKDKNSKSKRKATTYDEFDHYMRAQYDKNSK